MAREPYQEALSDLRNDVLAMGELVGDRLEMALDALETGDEDLARTVVEGDDEVNDLYLSLEDRCVDLIALQQPVAGDLRLVAASFKILTDLERIGDLASNLAGYALAASDDLTPEVAIDDIGRDALALLERSLAAYESEDADACRAIADADDDIDALCQHASETVVRDLIQREADEDLWGVEQLLDDVSRVLLIIRDLERVGDHAVNIAARTLYMVDTSTELIY
ncbi:phosphate signaling complex protein PhoU [Halomicroarcula sp. GCM10025324]|uniref:phosphate signaling complex protein PhoU n=1 Tax=Haloarcula TaxID=2237 RepID=UPI0023E764DA|nr:phosphate signaling complex protein PhoU [Halomicroarcula sp. ZS-22-S1]